MFLLALLIIQVPRIMSYDIEVEGTIHFDKDLVKQISSDIELKKRKEEFQLKLLAMEPILRSNKHQDNASEIIPSVPIEAVTIANKNDESNKPTEDPGFDALHFVKLRFNLIHQLRTSGSLRLKTLAYIIKKNLKTVPDIDTVLNNATSDYLKAVNEYNVFISNKTVMCNIDKEFAVLDMIETASGILLQEAKKLLNAIIVMGNNNELQTDMTKLMEKVEETVLEEKSEQLKYVCKELNVCRSFPGYCERIAEMLEELQQLTDQSFKQIVFFLNETITLKRDFFKTIMRDNVYNKLSIKLTDSTDNKFMREVFKIIRSVIIHRYKVLKNDSLIIKDKTKAVRILLDLIDRAFEENDNDVNYIDIENTISSYKQWAVGDRHDVGMITKKFVYNAVEIINYNWDKDVKEEVKVLTDVLFTGGTENFGVYDYLFTKGSTLIRNLA